MKVCFFTLGCKVNQQETAAMINIFSQNGWEIATDREVSDVYIVNSCTVTLSGDKKSIQWIRRAKKQNPDAVVVLCGCMPQAFPDKATAVEEADIIIGSKGKGQVFDLVHKYMQDKCRIVDIQPHNDNDTFEELSEGEDTMHTRAFLKIQDGCNRSCAYCIIPKARGRVRSRSVESIVEQAQRLADLGHKEIVLTGVNISCYGQDIGINVCDVIEAVAAIENIHRIRFGSLELDLFTDDMLVRMSKVKKFCPHFHLSLQSGCDRTLKAMNRLYDTKLYTDMMNRLKELFDRPVFTTDIIVGFPGETEKDFIESVNYVQKCEFLKVHTFSFSPRKGTAAYEMTDQIPNDVKSERNRTMTFKSEQTRSRIMESFIGFEDTALLEQQLPDGNYTAYTSRYVPVTVKDSSHLKSGDIVNVKLVSVDGQRMTAEIVKEI
ncbi:MAG: tRNA (N(6)-L-threonylcarbamoyladenosine(37)-C(2))-methylthiotransferase MtaB [Ruminococcaceae bacterium]|nr:tRNA (N(6)-L-threonylcarbamoyladenosine(37)-C(2))-methylthiotransferase MtaB [Oscillospiraceae bacterium]